MKTIVFLLVLFSCLFWNPVNGAISDFYRAEGEASFQFLKKHLSPRTVSLAGAGAGLPGSALEASDLNPASAASDSGVIYLGHGIPYAEFQGMMPNITWNIPVSEYKLYVNSRYLGIGDIPSYDKDNPDEQRGSYSAFTLKTQIGISGRYRKALWGVSANYALNNIAFANYHAVFFDAGLQYPLLSGLWAGASFTNAGAWTSSSYYAWNRDPVLPTTSRIGLSYRHKVWKQLSAIAAADLRSRNDQDPVVPLGVEVDWREVLFFRTGYPLLENEPAMSFGTGIRWGLFLLDYAFHRHETFSPGHYFSLGIRF